MKNKKGKTVAKENLPSKVCVVCNRPFTWRKKWERVWDDVTTCSKSCNAKRKQQAKQQQPLQQQQQQQQPSLCDAEGDGNDSIASASSLSFPENPAGCCGADGDASSAAATTTTTTTTPTMDPEKALRKQRKEAVKAQKRARKLKRMGIAPNDVGRKPCDLCSTQVDLLIRCTTDETQTFRMVCGRCWPGVSGGVPDGVSSTHPHYRYGGLWKNRSADLRKKVGNGSNGKNNNKNNDNDNNNSGSGASASAIDGSGSGSEPPPAITLMDEIEQSLREVAVEENGDE